MLANHLYESGLTHYSEPDFYINYEYYYNDPYYGQQYYLHNTGQSISLVDNSVFHCVAGVDLKTVQAWNFISNIENPYSTKVAIVDDGVENHEDLVRNGHSKVLSGFPAINRGRPKKCHAHGQCCAGIVAATSGNNKGIVGIDQNANIVPVRIALCDKGYFSYFMNEKRIARGIRKSWQDYDSDILNLSFGNIRFTSNQTINAIQDASLLGRNNKGCVVVAASGNNFRNDSISQIA
jgi:subtilisin family serine protease